MNKVDEKSMNEKLEQAIRNKDLEELKTLLEADTVR